jgi:lysophospholipase L1-like esterase
MKPLSRPKKVVLALLPTLITFALLFVLLEVGFARYYTEEASGNWIVFHPVRGWALAEGTYQVKPVHQLTQFALHIDKFGLRTLGAAAHVSRTRRLLVLGDSFTFAKETATEKTFTRLLQDSLDARVAGIEVLNAGVPAYGTAQQLLFLRELQERQITPDITLLVFFTNDILDNLCLSYGDLLPQRVRPCFQMDAASRAVLRSPPEPHLENGGDDTLVAAPPAPPGLSTPRMVRALAEDWLQTKPGLVRLLTGFGVNARVARMPGLLNGWYRDDIVAAGMSLTGALLREIDQETQRRGGRLIVTMVPSPFQVYAETYLPLLRHTFENHPIVEAFAHDLLRPQRLVRESSEAAGIPFEDLYPSFLDKNDSALFIPRDGHLTVAGHRLVASRLLEFVTQAEPEPFRSRQNLSPNR